MINNGMFNQCFAVGEFLGAIASGYFGKKLAGQRPQVLLLFRVGYCLLLVIVLFSGYGKSMFSLHFLKCFLIIHKMNMVRRPQSNTWLSLEQAVVPLLHIQCC